MGFVCGKPHISLYLNDLNPPLHQLRSNDKDMPEKFQTTGLARKDKNVYFDEMAIMKQYQAFHLEEIEIYYKDYITGLISTYLTNGFVRKLFHNINTHNKSEKLHLAQKESIVALEVTYSAEYIHSIKITTSQGVNFEVVGNACKGPEIATIDLSGDSRAIVAFKG